MRPACSSPWSVIDTVTRAVHTHVVAHKEGTHSEVALVVQIVVLACAPVAISAVYDLVLTARPGSDAAAQVAQRRAHGALWARPLT